jgi:hypothetical protein
MKVEVLQHYFVYTSIDIVTIPKDQYKTHVEKSEFFAVKNEATSF